MLKIKNVKEISGQLSFVNMFNKIQRSVQMVITVNMLIMLLNNFIKMKNTKQNSVAGIQTIFRNVIMDLFALLLTANKI